MLRITITSMNARQQVTASTLSSSMYATYGFDSFGYPTYSKAGSYAITSFEKVDTIFEAPYKARFLYNSENQRARMVVSRNDTTKLTRWYAGSRYMKETSGTTTKEYTYLGGDAYSAPVVAVTEGGTTSYYYLLRDYLGNVTHVVNSSYGISGEYSYDAWGRRRSADDWSYTLDANDTELMAGRGFTGHEHLPWCNLINMNGRLYDPVVGRFLSPDPYVQSPDFTQNFNRYSYCLNNPLKYTDPEGDLFVIEDWIVGGFKGLTNGEGFWNSANRQAWNSIKIWGGLFATDPNKNLSQRAWEFASRFTWQAPQTYLGFQASHLANMFFHVNSVDYAYGATVLQTNKSNFEFGAITLSNYIIGNRQMEANADNRWFQHEYGHYLQSQEMGLGYLSRVGIPSLMSAGIDDNNHSFQLFEQDANRRAFIYFNENVEGFYQTRDQYSINQLFTIKKGWNFQENPLDINHTGESGKYYNFHNSKDLTLINNNLSLHTKWYDYFGLLYGRIAGLLSVGIGNGIYYNNNRIK